MLGLNKTIINGIETVDVVEYARATNQKTKDIKEKFESKLIKKYGRYYLPSILLEELRGVVVIVKGITPLSINNMYRDNHRYTEDYEKFAKNVGQQIRSQLSKESFNCIDFTKMLSVEFIVNPSFEFNFSNGHYTAKDVDNMLKAVIDVLFKQMRGITSIGCLDDKTLGEITIKLNKDININDRRQAKEEGFQIRITNSEREYDLQTQALRLGKIQEIVNNQKRKSKKCS